MRDFANHVFELNGGVIDAEFFVKQFLHIAAQVGRRLVAQAAVFFQQLVENIFKMRRQVGV